MENIEFLLLIKYFFEILDRTVGVANVKITVFEIPVKHAIKI